MPRLRPCHPRGALVIALCASALLPILWPGLADGYRVRGNPADRLARLSIDAYRYDYARRCLKRARPGTLALRRWLRRNARGSSWGIMRCERLGGRNYSLHSEGRAIDWRLNVRRRAERRAATRLIRLFLATDKVGNAHALARRMGIQEIIWNCKSWWAGSARMGRYSACYTRAGKRRRVSDTLAHRDHMHIGLNWPGARKRTSFWRRRR
jgi:hypothetical protein